LEEKDKNAGMIITRNKRKLIFQSFVIAVLYQIIWAEARATSFAILIGSGIEPCKVKELSILIAVFGVKPQFRIKRDLPVLSVT